MFLRKPDFYDQFKCTADRCSDTCCVGWEIDVDKNSLARYQKVPGDFGKMLRKNIKEGHFKLLPQDRCPFLDKRNLCEIYKQLGEGALCDICREHPRFVEVYGDIMERGLGLCCEEAARLLLTGEGPLQFTAEECDEPEDEISEEDREILDQVLYERDFIFATFADVTKPFEKRLYEAFGYSGEKPFYPFENPREMVKLLAKTESYGAPWDKALERIESYLDQATPPISEQGFFTENESARLLSYLVYRHYAKCLFEGREQGKLLFAVFFWNVVRYFTRELAGDATDPMRIKIDAVKILSKQLEYAEENMELVETALEGGPDDSEN